MDENKKKALGAALMQIEKQFGKGSVMRMGDVSAAKGIEVVSTGSLSLDIALGAGGLPKGRIVEIYGPESSGKTTLTLQIIAECQKNKTQQSLPQLKPIRLFFYSSPLYYRVISILTTGKNIQAFFHSKHGYVKFKYYIFYCKEKIVMAV